MLSALSSFLFPEDSEHPRDSPTVKDTEQVPSPALSLAQSPSSLVSSPEEALSHSDLLTPSQPNSVPGSLSGFFKELLGLDEVGAADEEVDLSVEESGPIVSTELPVVPVFTENWLPRIQLEKREGTGILDADLAHNVFT